MVADNGYALAAGLAPVATTGSFSDLANIPPDLADGDDGFTTEGELRALLDDNYAGAVHSHSWSSLSDIPLDFADGVDNDTTYGAGTGLRLEGATFVADIDDSGASATRLWSSEKTSSTVSTRFEAVRSADDLTLNASGFIPSGYQGAVTYLYLRDVPDIGYALKQRLGVTSLTLADITAHVRHLRLSAETYDDSDPIIGTFQGFRFARVTQGPMGSDENDIHWTMSVTSDISGTVQDTNPTYKLIFVTAYFK